MSTCCRWFRKNLWCPQVGAMPGKLIQCFVCICGLSELYQNESRQLKLAFLCASDISCGGQWRHLYTFVTTSWCPIDDFQVDLAQVSQVDRMFESCRAHWWDWQVGPGHQTVAWKWQSEIGHLPKCQKAHLPSSLCPGETMRKKTYCKVFVVHLITIVLQDSYKHVLKAYSGNCKVEICVEILLQLGRLRVVKNLLVSSLIGASLHLFSHLFAGWGSEPQYHRCPWWNLP